MPLPADSVPLALTPHQRRARNRREMVEGILAAARATMREHGVAALNLNEVARRVQLRPQSLAEYFPSKSALYDALFLDAAEIFRAGDERAYRDYPPGWDQLEAWFANRITLAFAHPDLFRLAFDAPVADYMQAERVVASTREVLAGARGMVAGLIAAGVIDPGMAPERATDLLMAIRHGLIAEHLGKQPFLAPEGAEARFSGLLPDVMRTLRVAWSPGPRREGGAA